MNEIFRSVLNTSFQGGVLILAVLILRLVLQKAPKRHVYLLWLLVGLRLLVPFSVESELSLQPENQVFSHEHWQELQDYGQILPENVPVERPGVDSPGASMTPADTELDKGSAADDVAVAYTINWAKIAPYLWPIPAVVLGLYCLVSYLCLKRRMREAVKLTDGVWESDRIDTAFILGFLRPQIYLPMNLSDENRAFLMDHEWVHLKRGDHWVRLIGFAALTVHWFNPLVWVAYGLLCRDMEMACDEYVIRNMGLEERKRYSAALLLCSSNRSHFAACPVAFGEVSVKQRILAVLNYRKPRFWITALAATVVIVTAVCFLTSPVQKIDPMTLDDWGVTMTAVESNPTGMVVEFDLPEKAEGNFIFNFSLWALEKKDGAGWADVPMLPQEEPGMPWNGHVSMLFPNNEVQRIGLDWSTVYGEMPPGRYRVQGTLMLVQEGLGYNKDFYAEFSIGVVDRPARGERFAEMGEGWTWCSGISLDAVENAYYYREHTYRVDEKTTGCQSTGGPFDEKRFSELLEVLNSLHESAFTAKNTRNRRTIREIRTSFPAERGLSVAVTDGVNSLVVVLRFYNNGIKDVLELYMTDDVDEDAYVDTVLCWDIADDDLLRMMQELMENPAVVH